MSTDWDNLGIYSRAVWLTMSLAKDAGQSEMNKRQLIRGIGASKPTVLRATCELQEMGWVAAAQSFNYDTGTHNPTLYTLTEEAPHHSVLINSVLESEQ